MTALLPNIRSFGAATFLLDPQHAEPTIIEFRVPSLQLALIEREQKLLATDWQSVGFYFLIGPGSDSGRVHVYVGQTTNLAARISQHYKEKDWWDRALVVASNSRDGFSTAEAQWFEGYFVDLLAGASGTKLENGNRPQNNTLPQYHRDELTILARPVEAILRLFGINTYATEAEVETEATQPRLSRSPGKQMTWVEASLEVLPEDGTPMHAREILTRVVAAGLRDVSQAKTPENTLRRDLRQEVARDNNRVVQTGPSEFARRTSS